MDDGLDIPEFLRLEAPTPEDQKRLRRKWAREAREASAAMIPPPDFKPNLDKHGRSLPLHMDAGSWALLAEIEKAERAKEKENEAAKKERFRILAAARAEKAAIKRPAIEAQKATKF